LGITQWTSRALARQFGVHHSTVARLWREYDLQPRPFAAFEFSPDPELEAKACDIVALYLNPPDKAVALSADKPTSLHAPDQIQQPPPRSDSPPGHPISDDAHNDNPTLPDALQRNSRIVTDSAAQGGGRIDLVTFFQQLVQTYPHADLHVVCDGHANQNAAVAAWLAHHPHIIVYFTSTANWLHLFKVSLGRLTCRTIDRDGLPSIPDVVRHFINVDNEHGQPYIWIKDQKT
jgi:hypothetical protein